MADRTAPVFLRAVAALSLIVSAETGAQDINPTITAPPPAPVPPRQVWVDVHPGIPGNQRCRTDDMPFDEMVTLAGGMVMPADFVVEVRLESVTAATPLIGCHFDIYWDPAVVVFLGVLTPGFYGLDGFPMAAPLGPGSAHVVTGIDPCTGVTGPGMVAQLAFAALSDGVTGIDVDGVMLWRRLGACTPSLIPADVTNARSQVVVNHMGTNLGCWTCNRPFDGVDLMPGDGVADANPMLGIVDSTLAACITEANMRPGYDHIGFNVAGVAPVAVTPFAPLPAIADLTGGLFIDGDNTQPGITIDGAAVPGPGNGFTVTSGGNTIRGLHIINFPGTAITLLGATSTGNMVHGNTIGLDVADVPMPNSTGVRATAGAHDNDIGGPGADQGNVISGNSASAIVIDGTGVPGGASGNRVRGNCIGLDSGRTLPRGNAGNGVLVLAADGTVVGGTSPNEGNVIAANGTNGIELSMGSTNTRVEGNRIGIDALGGPDGNAIDGVLVDASSNNTIGGVVAAAANLIGANLNAGVEVANAVATGNLVAMNLIGTDPTGTQIRPNAIGVLLGLGADANVVGGVVDGTGVGNVISGNTLVGVHISGGNLNRVQANVIGLNASQGAALANGQGVLVDGDGQCNAIGGSNGGSLECLVAAGHEAEGNVISGNATIGVEIWGPLTSANLVSFNRIGTNAIGATFGNGQDGVHLTSGAHSNLVTDNRVEANGATGVRVSGASTDSNQVRSNVIGTLSNPNLGSGVDVHCGPKGTGIAQNAIQGNGEHGAVVRCPGTEGTTLFDNLIEFNGKTGVRVQDSAAVTFVLNNVIRANDSHGVFATSPLVTVSENQVTANGEAGIATTSLLVEATRNAIWDNLALGIDLIAGDAQGVTPNDAIDADAGANQLQNFPVLMAAVTSGANLVVQGTLDTAASGDYRVEFFASEACDPSGHGEGGAYLGMAEVSTDATGHASFNATVDALPEGHVIVTATATDAMGNTSEFSACLDSTQGGGCPGDPDLNGDGEVDGADLAILLGNWGGRGDPDINCDGEVDGADLAILLGNWS